MQTNAVSNMFQSIKIVLKLNQKRKVAAADSPQHQSGGTWLQIRHVLLPVLAIWAKLQRHMQ